MEKNMINLQTAHALCAIAREAGHRALHLREQDRLNLQRKDDGSPVTRADKESQEIILDGLRALTPDVPVIAEEQDDATTREAGLSTCWLVDPLDGTRDFIKGRNDFSVNIGLLVDNIPVFGLIFAPARDDMVFGSIALGLHRLSQGETIPVQPTVPHTPPRLLLSLRDAAAHPTDTWQKDGVIAEPLIHASAYKLALLACGEADLLLRTSITYEWDTAAGDALVRAMGGQLMTPDGTPLAYGKEGRANGAYLAFTGQQEAAHTFLQASGLSWPSINQKT